MTTLLLILIAIICYILGGVNAPVICSRYVYRKDVRRYGSTVGLMDFYRLYGVVALVIVVMMDIAKALLAVLIGGALLSGADAKVVGQLFAIFCLLLGHIYPAFNLFKGGKGVLCAGAAAMAIDWRVGLCCWIAYIVIVIFTRYVALASMASALLCPIFMMIFGGPEQGFTGLECVLALLCALLIVVKHGESILRLIGGTEPQLELSSRTTSRTRTDYDDYEEDMY